MIDNDTYTSASYARSRNGMITMFGTIPPEHRKAVLDEMVIIHRMWNEGDHSRDYLDYGRHGVKDGAMFTPGSLRALSDVVDIIGKGIKAAADETSPSHSGK